MKALFSEIRQGRIDDVRRRLEGKPSLVHAVATAPPAKDDGQSPLQVAIKTGRFAIAHLLLDFGADVDFMDRSDVNAWNTPVLHDAVRAAVMTSRWLRNDSFGSVAGGVWVPAHPPEKGTAAFAVLERLVTAGADVHATDSFGNTTLQRAILDARQILPTYRHTDPAWVDPKPLNDELVADLDRVFGLLYARGVDPAAVADRHSGQPVTRQYEAEPVARFLDPSRVPGGEPLLP